MSPTAIAFSRQISTTPRITARDGSSGVVATLWIAIRPVVMSHKTMSVKVPPTSTPIIFIGLTPLWWAAPAVQRTGQPAAGTRGAGGRHLKADQLLLTR